MSTTIYLIRDTTYHVAEGYKLTYEAAQEWIKNNPIRIYTVENGVKRPQYTYEIVAVDELLV
jgi:hypothetical protein